MPDVDAICSLMTEPDGSDKAISDKQQQQEQDKAEAEHCNGHHQNELAESSEEDDSPSEIRQKSILKKESGLEDKLKRTVSWHDFSGKELHTVREFVPR